MFQNKNRQAIVVLGMHRSGTSAVAGVVSRLGLALPRTPFPPSGANPRGYFESAPITQVNESILMTSGGTWSSCITFEPNQLAGLLTPAVRRLMFDLVRLEFGDKGSYVLKDPRLCLTLPAWLPALRAGEASIRVLIVVRHPAEVVRSLAARDGLSETETASVWLHHMLEAERISRGLDRAVISYAELMLDWRTSLLHAGRIAGVDWPRCVDLAGPDIDTFLEPSLRHHNTQNAPAAIGPAPISGMVDAAWSALRRLPHNPGDAAALACLDQVRAGFADWRRPDVRTEYQLALRPSDSRRGGLSRPQPSIAERLGLNDESPDEHEASEMLIGTVSQWWPILICMPIGVICCGAVWYVGRLVWRIWT